MKLHTKFDSLSELRFRDQRDYCCAGRQHGASMLIRLTPHQLISTIYQTQCIILLHTIYNIYISYITKLIHFINYSSNSYNISTVSLCYVVEKAIIKIGNPIKKSQWKREN